MSGHKPHNMEAHAKLRDEFLAKNPAFSATKFMVMMKKRYCECSIIAECDGECAGPKCDCGGSVKCEWCECVSERRWTMVPDAWAIIDGGKRKDWGVFLLEVQNTYPIPQDKLRKIINLWWFLDGTDDPAGVLRLIIIDRCGVAREVDLSAMVMDLAGHEGEEGYQIKMRWLDERKEVGWIEAAMGIIIPGVTTVEGNDDTNSHKE